MIGHVVCAGKDTPRAEVQRERILCAAQKCFIEHGFHAASMANIAAAAQMSAGLMYRYFENKSAIVRAIEIACSIIAGEYPLMIRAISSRRVGESSSSLCDTFPM